MRYHKVEKECKSAVRQHKKSIMHDEQFHPSSNIASISTAAPLGSAATPIAARAG
jgi:hypothetical protein